MKDENTFTDHHVNLSSAYLKVGQNTVTMNIFNRYRTDGVGLHKFTDKTDATEYLYT